MIDVNHLSSKKVAVIFKKQGEETTRFAKRRVAQTLLWLVHKGAGGVTALEVSSWALRLGAYIFTLRHSYGLNIATIREPHDGGSHGRYVLQDSVEILQIIAPSSLG
jgi:hypothetical protein